MMHPRPKLVLSACLGVRAVRYDGNIIIDENVERLKKFVEMLPVCPEVEIGLGVPRNPLVLYREDGKLQLLDTVTGIDYYERMVSYAKSLLFQLREVDGFLLKSASPSCGVGDARVYGRGRRVVGRSDGLFASVVRESLPLIPVESEKRLLNQDIRRNFYTRIFTLAYVRESLERASSAEDIVDLHRSLKYLLALYSYATLRKLGRLLAERGRYELEELKAIYRGQITLALSRPVRRGSYVNVLFRLYGHLSRKLNEEERRYLLTLLNKFAEGREELRPILTYFKSFVYRFGEEYLAEQRFLQPYPEDLDSPV